MRILLDTHVWLWSLLEPERLSRRVARQLADPRTEIYLSPVSVWEVLLLIERGRVVLGSKQPAAAWTRSALAASGVRSAPLSAEIAIESRLLDRYPSQDPADRFLIATCIVEDLALATADATIRKHAPVRCVW